MIKTYEQAIDFINVSNQFSKEKTKFGYACQKVGNRVLVASKKVTKIFEEKVADIDIEFASVDENENLITVEGKFKYTKENAKKKLEAIRSASKSLYVSEIEFEPYYATEIPELTEYQINCLEGFVIEPKIEK